MLCFTLLEAHVEEILSEPEEDHEWEDITGDEHLPEAKPKSAAIRRRFAAPVYVKPPGMPSMIPPWSTYGPEVPPRYAPQKAPPPRAPQPEHHHAQQEEPEVAPATEEPEVAPAPEESSEEELLWQNMEEVAIMAAGCPLAVADYGPLPGVNLGVIDHFSCITKRFGVASVLHFVLI